MMKEHYKKQLDSPAPILIKCINTMSAAIAESLKQQELDISKEFIFRFYSYG